MVKVDLGTNHKTGKATAKNTYICTELKAIHKTYTTLHCFLSFPFNRKALPDKYLRHKKGNEMSNVRAR